jgi:hypothetical protein
MRQSRSSGSVPYLNDLAEAVRSCGLAWEARAALGNIDEACIHHAPATVNREAQVIYQALAGLSVDPVESPTNRTCLAADERARESLAGRRMAQLLTRLEESEHLLHQTRVELEEASVEASRIREQLGWTQDRLRETQEPMRDTEDQMVRSHAEAGDLLIRSRTRSTNYTRLEHFERYFMPGPALRGHLKTVFGMLRDRARCERRIAHPAALRASATPRKRPTAATIRAAALPSPYGLTPRAIEP